jgi:hypothetical protein
VARSVKVTVLVALPTLVLGLFASGQASGWLMITAAALGVLVWVGVALWASDEAVLDRLIKRGNAAREEIIDRGLDEGAATDVYEVWYAQTLRRLDARLGHYKDEFIVADEPQPEGYSGQVAVIRRLVAKLGVLTTARKGRSA